MKFNLQKHPSLLCNQIFAELLVLYVTEKIQAPANEFSRIPDYLCSWKDIGHIHVGQQHSLLCSRHYSTLQKSYSY